MDRTAENDIGLTSGTYEIFNVVGLSIFVRHTKDLLRITLKFFVFSD